MSGIYNVWQKVLNPNVVLPQMTSDTQLPPFYFGGSWVPTYSHKPSLLEGIKDYKRGGATEVSLSKTGTGVKSIYYNRH